MKHFSFKKTTSSSSSIKLPIETFTREAIQIILNSRIHSTPKKILDEQIEEFFNEEYLSLKNIKLNRVILELYLQYNNTSDRLLIEKWVFNQSTMKPSLIKVNVVERLRSIYLLTRMSPAYSLSKGDYDINYKLFSNSKTESIFTYKTLETRIGSIESDIEVVYEYMHSSMIKKLENGEYYNKERPRFYSESQKGKFQFHICKYEDNVTITDDYYSYNEKRDNRLKVKQRELNDNISKEYNMKGTSLDFEHIKTEDTLENSNGIVYSKSSSSSFMSPSLFQLDGNGNGSNSDSDDNNTSYQLIFNDESSQQSSLESNNKTITAPTLSIDPIIIKFKQVKDALKGNKLQVNLIDLVLRYNKATY